MLYMEENMKLLAMLIEFIIILLSILIGIFPVLANSTSYYILYLLLFSLIGIVFFSNLGNGKIKYNIILVVLFIFVLLGIYYREQKATLYALSFVGILASYYSLSEINSNQKLFIKISTVISFFTIPTIIFNGMFNPNIIGGTAFSGRLNPFMYFPFVLIAHENTQKKTYLNIFLKLTIILIIIDMIWSESRIALLGIIFILVMFFLYKSKKNDYINKNIKKILKFVLILLLIIQISLPSSYISLYENYRFELNEITYKYTGKHFFSGRQSVWLNLYRTVEKSEMWGTGDVLYEMQAQAPHNEFLNIYYCWGKIVAYLTTIYILCIGLKSINNMKNNIDLIVILGYLATIICTTFETYLYTAHFFIFNSLLTSNILIRKKERRKKYARISYCNNSNI